MIHTTLLSGSNRGGGAPSSAGRPGSAFGGRTTTAEEPAAGGPRWLIASAGGMGFFCRPDLSETTRSGRRIARLKEGDEIVVASLAEGDTITAATKDGQVLTFPADELPGWPAPGAV
jgi:DNA gyrase/topoisomerase IV subunit A